MDKWASKWRSTRAKGDVITVRYVDDAVFGFQYETDGRTFLAALRERRIELIRRMHDPLESVGAWLASVIRGFTNYHAVPSNMKAAREFYTQAGRMWLWAIRRCSQKAEPRWTWERFYRLQNRWLPRPRLVHPFPSVRFDAKYAT